MSSFKVGDVVVHKTLGSQPLTIIELHTEDVTKGDKIKTKLVNVDVRYAISGQFGLEHFTSSRFIPEELETPLESISREADIFQALNAKRDEINGKASTKPGPVGISHLN